MKHFTFRCVTPLTELLPWHKAPYLGSIPFTCRSTEALSLQTQAPGLTCIVDWCLRNLALSAGGETIQHYRGYFAAVRDDNSAKFHKLNRGLNNAAKLCKSLTADLFPWAADNQGKVRNTCKCKQQCVNTMSSGWGGIKPQVTFPSDDSLHHESKQKRWPGKAMHLELKKLIFICYWV